MQEIIDKITTCLLFSGCEACQPHLVNIVGYDRTLLNLNLGHLRDIKKGGDIKFNLSLIERIEVAKVPFIKNCVISIAN